MKEKFQKEICLAFEFSFTSQSCPVLLEKKLFWKTNDKHVPSNPKRFFWNLIQAFFYFGKFLGSHSLTKRSVSVNLGKIVHVNVTSAKSREYAKSFIIPALGAIAPSVTEEACCFVGL